MTVRCSRRSNAVTDSIDEATSWPYAPTFWIGVPPTVPGMPERHSMPASPRLTAKSTSGSHSSPAPAETIVSSPSIAALTPRRATCRTRPSNPSSAITRLLPPPSTNNGAPRAAAHPCAAITSLIEVARANHRAAPPTPSVLSGASGTPCSGGSNGTQPLLLRDKRPHRLDARAERELEPFAGRKLSCERKVGGDHGRDLRVPAGRLPIGHQEDRIAGRRNLQAAHEGDVGDHLAGSKRTREAESGPFGPGDQSVTHSIRLRRDHK